MSSAHLDDASAAALDKFCRYASLKSQRLPSAPRPGLLGSVERLRITPAHRRRAPLITLRGQLRYRWLGMADPKREPASFILFVPTKPGLKIVAQDGKPLAAEHLISSVNPVNL